MTKLILSNNLNFTRKDLCNVLAAKPTLQALYLLENPRVPLSVVPEIVKATTNAPDSIYYTELSRRPFNQYPEHYNARHTKYVRALASPRAFDVSHQVTPMIWISIEGNGVVRKTNSAVEAMID